MSIPIQENNTTKRLLTFFKPASARFPRVSSLENAFFIASPNKPNLLGILVLDFMLTGELIVETWNAEENGENNINITRVTASLVVVPMVACMLIDERG